MLQLERLKATSLSDTSVLVISPDAPEDSRVFVARVEKERRTRLTHRFLSAPRAHTLNRRAPAGEGKAPLLPPSLVLVDRDGREAWRFVEVGHRARPTDREIARAIAEADRPRP